MIAFANCKINLGLFVTGKRADGYHDIESVFYPVQWTDTIEVEETGGPGKCSLAEYGLQVGGDPEKNLCVKAYRLLDRLFALPPVKLHVFKSLPMGAGLGGGSADGSTTLRLLNQRFGLNLTDTELVQMAAQLGSDCPFFIHNRPALVTGRGEVLDPINIDLSDFHLLIVHPALHMSTAEAYSLIKPKPMDFDLREKILASGADHWKDFLRNDFEPPVFGRFPLIGSVKDTLYEKGAVFALMSGSGSSVFGLFEHSEAARAAQDHFKHYLTRLVLPAHHLALV